MHHSLVGAIAAALFLPMLGLAQSGPPTLDHHEPMQLAGIQVTETRLPAESIIRISGLKVGQMIDDASLREASDKITSTGLVKGLDYEFNSTPGKPGVYLSIKVFEEGPLLPARIMPSEAAEPIWACLRSADAIFTPEMPNTEKAIHFYSVNIARCLQNEGAREKVSATVACDGTGKSIAIDFHVPRSGAASAANTGSH